MGDHGVSNYYLVSNLRIIRKRRFLSQYELAALADMNRSAIAHLERGRGRATGSTVRLLAKALEVDASALVEEGLTVDTNSRETGRRSEIITSAPEAYDGFSTKTREWLRFKSRSGPLRKVTIDEVDLAWQKSRYASGSYETLTQVDFEYLAQLWTPIEEGD